jgi:hypothetical protein
MKKETQGPAMVTCIVCKEQVTRRSTLMTTSGRVCRKHPGSVKAAQEYQADLEAIHAASRGRH